MELWVWFVSLFCSCKSKLYLKKNKCFGVSYKYFKSGVLWLHSTVWDLLKSDMALERFSDWMQLPEQTCQLSPFHKSWCFGAWDFGNISDVTPFKLCGAEPVWSVDFCHLLPEHWSAGEHFYPNRRLTSLWKLSVCFLWKTWTAVQRAFLTGNCWTGMFKSIWVTLFWHL